MKKVIYILLFVVILTGCKEEEIEVKEKIRAVKTEIVSEEKSEVVLDYIGIVDSKDLTKYSFKSNGKLGKIYVKEGEKIKKGQKLVELDKSDLENSLDAAYNKMQAAKSQYEKAKNGAREETIKQVKNDLNTAEDAYKFTKENYEDLKKLYENGAISSSKLDEIELKYNQAKNTYEKVKEGYKEVTDGARLEDIESAESNYKAAKAAYEIQKSLLEDSVINAKFDGTVVKLPFKENEMVPAGHPAVVVRSNNQIVNVGIALKDLNKIEVSDKAIIKIDDEVTEGEVLNIDESPDSMTRTYNAEVAIEGEKYRLGTIANVSIIIGNKQAIWIPYTAIASNGIDYVYVVKDNRAVKKEIKIEKIENDRVRVSGIKEGEEVIIKGVRNIRDGSKVNIIGEENEETN